MVWLKPPRAFTPVPKSVSYPPVRSVRFVQVEPKANRWNRQWEKMALVHCKFILGVLNMNAAGMDVSSRKSTVAVLRPFGEVVRVPFEVSHSAEGLAHLVQQLKTIKGETRVVMEYTGRYYEAVANVLYEAGFFVSAVNPLLIKEYGGNSLSQSQNG